MSDPFETELDIASPFKAIRYRAGNLYSASTRLRELELDSKPVTGVGDPGKSRNRCLPAAIGF
jgi:hypothetical protein